MHYIIHPYQGVEIQGGPRLEFGQSIEQVESVLGEPSFVRTFEKSGNQRRRYGNLVVGIAPEDTRVQSFEFHNVPDVKVLLNGKDLMHNSYREISQYLISIGQPYVEDQGYFGVGINIWQNLEESDAEPDTVFVFRQGLWKETPEEMRTRIQEENKNKPRLSKEEFDAWFEDVTRDDNFLED